MPARSFAQYRSEVEGLRALFAHTRKYKIGFAYIADSALPIALERFWVRDASATGLAENGMHSQRRGRLLL